MTGGCTLKDSNVNLVPDRVDGVTSKYLKQVESLAMERGWLQG